MRHPERRTWGFWVSKFLDLWKNGSGVQYACFFAFGGDEWNLFVFQEVMAGDLD